MSTQFDDNVDLEPSSSVNEQKSTSSQDTKQETKSEKVLISSRVPVAGSDEQDCSEGDGDKSSSCCSCSDTTNGSDCSELVSALLEPGHPRDDAERSPSAYHTGALAQITDYLAEGLLCNDLELEHPILSAALTGSRTQLLSLLSMSSSCSSSPSSSSSESNSLAADPLCYASKTFRLRALHLASIAGQTHCIPLLLDSLHPLPDSSQRSSCELASSDPTTLQCKASHSSVFATASSSTASSSSVSSSTPSSTASSASSASSSTSSSTSSSSTSSSSTLQAVQEDQNDDDVQIGNHDTSTDQKSAAASTSQSGAEQPKGGSDSAAARASPVDQLALENGLLAGDCFSMTAAHWAAVYRHAPVLRALLAHARALSPQALRALLTCTDDSGLTPLHVAACYGDGESVRLLLEAHEQLTELTQQTDQELPPASQLLTTGRSVFKRRRVVAQQEGTHEDNARSPGARSTVSPATDATVVDTLALVGATAMHLAALNGNANTLVVLRDAGFSASVLTQNGFAPIHLVCRSPHPKCTGVLLDAQDAQVSQPLSQFGNQTPLHICAAFNNVVGLEVLLKHGADIDAQDSLGATPLYRAAENGYLTCVRFLVKNGADIEKPERFGHSPLAMAAANGKSRCCEYLMNEAGAKVTESVLKYVRTFDKDEKERKKKAQRAQQINLKRHQERQRKEALEAAQKAAETQAALAQQEYAQQKQQEEKERQEKAASRSASSAVSRKENMPSSQLLQPAQRVNVAANNPALSSAQQTHSAQYPRVSAVRRSDGPSARQSGTSMPQQRKMLTSRNVARYQSLEDIAPVMETSSHRGSRDSHSTTSTQMPTEPGVWVDDDASSSCMVCDAEFTVVFRRHHCRSCGRLVCGDCSKRSMPLPMLKLYKPVRVCKECFAHFYAESEDLGTVDDGCIIL